MEHEIRRICRKVADSFSNFGSYFDKIFALDQHMIYQSKENFIVISNMLILRFESLRFLFYTTKSETSWNTKKCRTPDFGAEKNQQKNSHNKTVNAKTTNYIQIER